VIKPILIEIPDAIETQRLVLRPPVPGRGAIVNHAIAESFHDLKAWMPWAQTMPTVEESEEYCRGAAARFLQRTDLSFQVFRKEDGEYVGGSGFHDIDWGVPRLEIGYWCRTRFQRNGYVSEAVIALTEFAFSRFAAARVEIRCDERNERSRRVAVRAGFRMEARFPAHARSVDGSLRTTLVFARTAIPG
jgi:RimJ/RimL family protein N-acetyltransferase